MLQGLEWVILPRFMNRPETVTQQILGVQSLNILELFWQMTLRRVIAKNMLDCDPYSLGTVKYPTLQMM